MKKFLFPLILILVILSCLGIFYFVKLKKSTPQKDVKKVDILKVKDTETKPKQIARAESFEVPILMYHYIRDAENEDELGKGLSVSPANFEAQLKWLKENNYRSMTLADLADPERKVLSGIIFEKQKPVIITFDDGYLDAHTQAYPLLKKYDFKGVFYIIRNNVGKDDSFYMNAAQIAELKKAGHEIGSHSLSHPDLSKSDETNARKQIFDSKSEAETFCYPAGRYNDTTVSLVKAAGYKAAVTTKFGIATEKSNLWELRRVRIENVGPQAFADKISAAWDQTPRAEKH